MAGGTDYTKFWATAVYDHALYVQRPDGSAGFSKIVVNENGQLVEEGNIPTVSNTSYQIAIKDAEIGVFQDRATPKTISIFNPKTLKVTSTINMSGGVVPGNINQRYQRFMFRGDDLFAVVRGEAGELFSTLVVHQANVKTGNFIGATQRGGNGMSTINYFEDFGQNIIDSEGNLYIIDAGNLEAQGIAARVNKIPAGSNTIDASYKFEPAKILNPANQFLPTIYKCVAIGNNKAVAVVNYETPQAAVDIVIGAGGLQNLTATDKPDLYYSLYSNIGKMVHFRS